MSKEVTEINAGMEFGNTASQAMGKRYFNNQKKIIQSRTTGYRQLAFFMLKVSTLLTLCTLGAAFSPLAYKLASTSSRSTRLAFHSISTLSSNQISSPHLKHHFSSSSALCATPSSSSKLGSKNICILGGGFGGLNTALTLSSLPWPDDDVPTITLVDKKERFVFLPLLYELCVGDAELEEVAPTYKSLLEGTNIQFVRGTIEGIDVDNSLVYIDQDDFQPINSSSSADNGSMNNKTPAKLSYDALVLATGADISLSTVPGAETYALPFYTVEDCYQLRKRLVILDEVTDTPFQTSEDFDFTKRKKIDVVVVGGGYSGVELALNMMERVGGRNSATVTLVHRGESVLQYATEYNQRTGRDRLVQAGIEVLTEKDVVEVSSCLDKTEKNDNGIQDRCRVGIQNRNRSEGDEIQFLNADLLLWTAGSTSSNIPKGILNSNLPRDAKGRIVTGKLLRAKGFKNVFALGDCSRARQVPYGATAQVAIQQAPVVAWNVYATFSDEILGQNVANRDSYTKLLPFQYIDLGEMMTLGGDDATISSLEGLVQLSGPGASLLRRLIYAARMPTIQQALTAAVLSTEKRLASVGSGTEKKKRKNGTKPSRKIIDWK